MSKKSAIKTCVIMIIVGIVMCFLAIHCISDNRISPPVMCLGILSVVFGIYGVPLWLEDDGDEKELENEDNKE